MTPAEFRAALDRLGLSRSDLMREIEVMTGHRLAPSTLYRWDRGTSRMGKPIEHIDPWAAAYLRMRLHYGPPPRR